jgi:hypothetical protein
VSILQETIFHLCKRREAIRLLGDAGHRRGVATVQGKSMNADPKVSALTRGIRKQRRGVLAAVGGVMVATIMVLGLAQAGLALADRSGGGDRDATGYALSMDFTPGTFGPAATPSIMIVTGEGTFSHHDVDGGGVWTAVNPSFQYLAGGTWEAKKMVSFVSYGILGPRVEGGNLTLLVNVHFDGSDNEVAATLQITCVVGSPPSGVFEGFSLVGPGLNFIHPFTPPSGNTIFIPDIHGAGISDVSLEIAAVSRSSIGACHLGCC